MKKKVVYIVVVLLVFCLFCQSNIFSLSVFSSKKFCSRLSMNSYNLQIDLDAGKFLKVTNQTIDFKVKIKNLGPIDCSYYKVVLRIFESLFVADLIEELEPIYIFNDSKNPLKADETHELNNIWSWIITEDGLYRVKATVFEESGRFIKYDSQYILLRTPINRNAKYRQSCNSFFYFIFEQFPILHRLLNFKNQNLQTNLRLFIVTFGTDFF